jgi:hypothetical protein
MENVLFFPLTITPLNFEAELELMIKEIEAANNVYLIYCKKDFKI